MILLKYKHLDSIDFPGGSDSKASVYNEGNPGLIPGSERSPGEGNGNPLQYSCLENSVDGGFWWATVHGVAKSQTRLNDFTFPLLLSFTGGSAGKESACNAGDLSPVPGLGRSPGGGHSNPNQYSCLENPHGEWSLAGYSPWDPKELDTTERPSTAQHMIIIQRLAMQL